MDMEQLGYYLFMEQCEREEELQRQQHLKVNVIQNYSWTQEEPPKADNQD